MYQYTYKKTLKTMLLSLAVISLTAGFSAIADEANKTPNQWSYTGNTGPQHWAELSPENVLCGAGKNQSPINIKSNKTGNYKQPAIKLNYNLIVADEIKNTGQTVQVDMRSGGVMTLDGEKFELKRFQFHTPSENTFNGKHLPIEVQFIHENDKGELAVLAMLFVPGKPDATLNRLWKDLPMKAGESARLDSNALKTIESESSFSNYYRFNGSLTTPPCTEGVRWVIMQTPMSVSKEQLQTLQAALKDNNNRPVQPLNARMVLE